MKRVAGVLVLLAVCQGASPAEAASPPGGTPCFGAGLGLTRLKVIAGGGAHALSLRADGTVWAWGANGAGRLGDDTLTDHPVPTRIATHTGSTAPIPLGSGHSLALFDGIGKINDPGP